MFYSPSRSFCQSSIFGDSIKSMLVKDWERGKAYSQDYMKSMPADKFSFKVTESAKYMTKHL